jgi:hypothetical protein
VRSSILFFLFLSSSVGRLVSSQREGGGLYFGSEQDHHYGSWIGLDWVRLRTGVVLRHDAKETQKSERRWHNE